MANSGADSPPGLLPGDGNLRPGRVAALAVRTGALLALVAGVVAGSAFLAIAAGAAPGAAVGHAVAAAAGPAGLPEWAFRVGLLGVACGGWLLGLGLLLEGLLS